MSALTTGEPARHGDSPDAVPRPQRTSATVTCHHCRRPIRYVVLQRRPGLSISCRHCGRRTRIMPLGTHLPIYLGVFLALAATAAVYYVSQHYR